MKIFRDKKNMILFVLVIAVLIMGYGYSVLLQQLSIHGSAEIDNGSWQIEIIDIKDKSILGSAKVLEKPTFTKSTATLKSGFSHTGDSIVYEMTVANKGGLDAKLDTINIVSDTNAKNAITYKITNVTPGGTLLPVGETNKIHVTVTYSNPENLSSAGLTENVKILVNYVQDHV